MARTKSTQRVLAGFVTVQNPETGELFECEAGSAPPAEVADLITNPAAWRDVEYEENAPANFLLTDLTRRELAQVCEGRGITHDDYATKEELAQLIRAHDYVVEDGGVVTTELPGQLSDHVQQLSDDRAAEDEAVLASVTGAGRAKHGAKTVSRNEGETTED